MEVPSWDTIQSQTRQLFQGERETLVRASLLQGILAFPFTICAFVVADTANAGFNVVLTAFIYIGFVAGMYYSLQMQPSRSSRTVGFLMGCSGMITILSLMTAIFWGQLSNCELLREGDEVGQYSCSNTTAYGAVCFFSSVMFVVQVATTYGLVIWRDELSALEEPLRYNKLPTAQSEGLPYDESVRPSTDL